VEPGRMQRRSKPAHLEAICFGFRPESGFRPRSLPAQYRSIAQSGPAGALALGAKSSQIFFNDAARSPRRKSEPQIFLMMRLAVAAGRARCNLLNDASRCARRQSEINLWACAHASPLWNLRRPRWYGVSKPASATRARSRTCRYQLLPLCILPLRIVRRAPLPSDHVRRCRHWRLPRIGIRPLPDPRTLF
jgi:hypothetical protein